MDRERKHVIKTDTQVLTWLKRRDEEETLTQDDQIFSLTDVDEMRWYSFIYVDMWAISWDLLRDCAVIWWDDDYCWVVFVQHWYEMPCKMIILSKEVVYIPKKHPDTEA